MHFNSLCQTFFHLVDERFYRKLARFSLCRHYEKARQVSGLQVIVDSNDQDSSDDFFRDSTCPGCLNGKVEVLFAWGILDRQTQEPEAKC
jgi:hypothetical protein